MAMYAFRDEEKTDKVYAADFLKEHLPTLYFCPDEKCAARMQLCEREGVSRAYFRALPKHPHRTGCPFAASDNFHPEKHNERAFDFDSAMDALFLPTKRKNKIDAPSLHRSVPRNINCSRSKNRDWVDIPDDGGTGNDNLRDILDR
jgi:hypothetical protein